MLLCREKRRGLVGLVTSPPWPTELEEKRWRKRGRGAVNKLKQKLKVNIKIRK